MTAISKLLLPRFACVSSWLLSLIMAVVLMADAMAVWGQSAITFDDHPYFAGTNYVERGMQFQVIVPTPGPGSPNHDDMGISPAITNPWNLPYNSTPFIYFIQQISPDDYVRFSLTSGDTFGLTSVDLADPNSPSLSPVAILFKGYKSGGAIVTQTFTTPGNGATTFQDYLFNSNFTSGLTSVDILSTRWAMDNLVVVPEPSTVSLLALGLLGLAGWKGIRRFER